MGAARTEALRVRNKKTITRCKSGPGARLWRSPAAARFEAAAAGLRHSRAPVLEIKLVNVVFVEHKRFSQQHVVAFDFEFVQASSLKFGRAGFETSISQRCGSVDGEIASEQRLMASMGDLGNQPVATAERAVGCGEQAMVLRQATLPAYSPYSPRASSASSSACLSSPVIP